MNSPKHLKHFPPAKLIVLLLAVILFEFLTHSNFNSPYVYYTEGNFELVNKTYGAHLGPPGTLLHYDTVNYWTIQGLFSGKYGARLSCRSRPFFPFVASIFDNYFDKVYVGWLINVGLWMLGCVFGYAWIMKLSGNGTAATLFASCVAMTPGYINMVWQPMGYIMGYSLLVVYLYLLANIDMYQAKRWSYVCGHIFLLSVCSLTYEILGPICVVLFVGLARGRLRRLDIALAVLSMVLVRLLWTNILLGELLDLGGGRVVSSGNNNHIRADPCGPRKAA